MTGRFLYLLACSLLSFEENARFLRQPRLGSARL